VQNGRGAGGGELSDAADIAGGDYIGLSLGDIGELAFAQLAGDFRLQQVVSPGRAAAQVPLRHVEHLEPGRSQQCIWCSMNALAMLHRAGGMIGDAPTGDWDLGRKRA
jgi:hypothetical protein